MLLMKSYCMLQNAKLAAFTVYELSRENQQSGEITPTSWLGLKNLVGYHDLYMQYIITSWYIWKLLKKIYWNIWTWSCSFSFCTRIGMASMIKKDKVVLEFLTDVDMLLIVLKGIRGGIYNLVYQYATAINKYIKHYNQNKESSHI